LKKSILFYLNLSTSAAIIAALIAMPSRFAMAQSNIVTTVDSRNSIRVVNEVIFHLQQRAYTLFDLRQFESVRSEVTKDLMDQQSQMIKKLNAYDAFLLYVICQNEAEALDLILDTKKMAKLDHDKKQWKIGYFRANLYLQSKESLFSDQDRFNSWFSMLKNKYDFFRKTNSTVQ
jgi:predicted RNA-binding protein with EMAP domain